MRKVLSKNPQVEQQRLHRRVFLDNVTPENQALLVSVKQFDARKIIYYIHIVSLFIGASYLLILFF